MHAGVAHHGAGGDHGAGGSGSSAGGGAADGSGAGDVVGVGQLYPAVNAAAPQDAVDLGGLHNDQLCAGGHGANLGVVAAGAVADVAVAAGDGHGGAVLGIQGAAGSGGAEVLHTGAAGGRGEPAAEGGAGAGGIGGQDAHIGAGQVGLHLVFAVFTGHAAVGVQDNVCILGGGGLAVDAVQVQVGLGQAAVQQGGIGGGAHIGPQGDGEQEGVHIGVAGDGLEEAAALGGPVGAAVEAEANQRIVLVLAQIQIVSGGELVDFGVDKVQTVPQGQVCLGLGDGLALGTHGAVANGPLAHVPIGRGAEALELLNQGDHILTVHQIGCGLGGDGPQGKQADGKYHSHDHASDSSFHKLLAPLSF